MNVSCSKSRIGRWQLQIDVSSRVVEPQAQTEQRAMRRLRAAVTQKLPVINPKSRDIDPSALHNDRVCLTKDFAAIRMTPRLQREVEWVAESVDRAHSRRKRPYTAWAQRP